MDETIEIRESGPLCFEAICPKCKQAIGRWPTQRAIYYAHAELEQAIAHCPDHPYRNH